MILTPEGATVALAILGMTTGLLVVQLAGKWLGVDHWMRHAR